MEDGELIPRSFHLCPRHYTFLEYINKDSRSQALRTVLDSIINGEEQTQRKQILDRNLNYIWMGIIFLVLSYLVPFEIKAFIILSGASFAAYGIYGGVKHALSRTKHSR